MGAAAVDIINFPLCFSAIPKGEGRRRFGFVRWIAENTGEGAVHVFLAEVDDWGCVALEIRRRRERGQWTIVLFRARGHRR